MLETIAGHEHNVNLLEALIVTQSEEKDELEVYRDKHEIVKEDLQNQINQLEYQLDQTSEKLTVGTTRTLTFKTFYQQCFFSSLFSYRFHSWHKILKMI